MNHLTNHPDLKCLLMLVIQKTNSLTENDVLFLSEKCTNLKYLDLSHNSTLKFIAKSRGTTLMESKPIVFAMLKTAIFE